MLDIKYIVDNVDYVRHALKSRNSKVDIDGVVQLYDQLRCNLRQVEELKAIVNKSSSTFSQYKKNGQDTTQLQAQVSQYKTKIKSLDNIISNIQSNLHKLLLNFPNIPHSSVHLGDGDVDNVLVMEHGVVTKFDFDPKPHWELGKDIGILDQDAAAKITGSRFYVYCGLGARLERSLVNFMLDVHTSNGYTEMFAPFMVNADSMLGTGQLPKFEDDVYKVADTNYYLVPTAEVSLTNLHRQEILAKLPINYCAYSACFRKEGGSAGRDTRGLIRQHQFNKVELVKFCRPQDSMQELDKLCIDAQSILQQLQLPYRVMSLCSGDLGFSSLKTYDIEVWLPSYNKYVEISSCSNFGDFQARRAGIRYRDNNKTQFVHTLNGSGLAIGRTVAAILENYQQRDGSIKIPDVLHKYMGVDVLR